MKAVAITQIGQTSFRDIAEPIIGADEVLLDVRYVGLCGSDLNTFRGLNPLVEMPRVPGHEIGGVILDRGANVPNDFATGASAIVIPYTTCGDCSSCRSGRVNACQFNKTLGVQQDGGLCDRIAVRYDRLILNDVLDLRQQALVEPLSVGFHAAARGSVGPDDIVVVLGGGMIGIGVMMGALARGAQVIAVEISAAKTETLNHLGVSAVVNPTTQDVASELDRLTDGKGADVVIEAVGLPETFRSAIDLVNFAGRVVYVGYAKSEVSYNTSQFNLKELGIFGSRNATRKDFEDVIAYMENAPDVADMLISKTFDWADADGAFQYWDANRDATFKIMIDMGATAAPSV